METRIDIRAALGQLGVSWAFGGSVTEGTQACWDAVVWEDARQKPEWGELVTAAAAEQSIPYDIPVGEADTLIHTFPTLGWYILAQLGIE